MWLSPAIRACQIALVNHWRHLHAIVACNAVKPSFVALAVSKKRFLCPVTNLDSAMFTNDVIALLLQLGLKQWVHREADVYC